MTILAVILAWVAIVAGMVTLVWWFLGITGFGLGGHKSPRILRTGAIAVVVVALTLLGVGFYILWREIGAIPAAIGLILAFLLKDLVSYMLFKTEINSTFEFFRENRERASQWGEVATVWERAAVKYIVRHYRSRNERSG